MFRKGLLCAFVLAMLLTVCVGAAQAEAVTLPENVTVIEEKAFYGDTSIETVYLPEGILKINKKAFAGSGVTEINLPSTLTYIAENAFDQTPLKRVTASKGSYAYDWAVAHGYISAETDASLFTYSSPSNDCVSITGFADTSSYPAEIVIPEKSPGGYLITGISSSAFSGCENLTSVYIPGNVKTIYDNAFRSCTGMTTLILGEGVSNIKGTVNYVNGAFAYCSALEQVVIPSTMTNIGNCAFYGCTSLTSLTMHDNSEVKMTIGSEAFYKTGLTGALAIPGKVSSIGASAFQGTAITKLTVREGANATTIGESAFEGCVSLTSVYLSGSVQKIVARAFYGCSELIDLTLNEGLVYINGVTNYVNGAFAYCTKLETVVIPSTVSNIGNRTFYGCTALTSLTIRDSSEVQMTIGTEAFYNAGLTGTLTIPAKVSSVGASAFSGTAISGLVIAKGENLTAIGKSAFESCLSLTAATIPGNVQTINARAFYGCSELVDLTLNEGLLTIGGETNYVNGAFANCTKLEKVVIPSTVTTIANRAFCGCTALTYLTILDSSEVQVTIGTEAFYQTSLTGTLTIPAKVSSIGTGAFKGTSITLLVLQKSDYLTAIGESAFEGCISLTAVTIPGNVQTINQRAFFGCSELVDLTLSEGLVTIGGAVNYVNGAFANCTKLEKVVIPSTVATIANRAFCGCTALTSLTIRDSEEFQVTIGTEAFYQTNLSNRLTIPAKVSAIGTGAFKGTPILSLVLNKSDYLTIIGEAAFEGCTELISVEIPGNVKTISNRAFIDCSSLFEVTLSEGLEVIGGTVNYVNGAFANCILLNEVVIPSTVTEIANRAFYGCSNLTDLTILDHSDIQMTIGTEAFNKTNLTGVLTLPEKTSTIGASAFAGTLITEVIIPENEILTAIGESAFEGCFNLTTVNIPGNIQTINNRAFYGCAALEELTFNEGLVTIGGTVNYVNGAFAYCKSLKTLVIPSTVTRIDNRAFYDCSNIVSVTMLDSSEVQMSIGTEAFYLAGLTGTLTIPSKVTSIETNAFGMTGITKLVMKESEYPTTIGDSAFESCLSLTTAYLPGNVQSIGARAFASCTKLVDLTLSEGLVTIGGTVNYANGAFVNCISLEKVVIPSTVTTIANRAFYDCTSLSEILIKALPENISIGHEAFYNCAGIPEYVE